MGEAFWLVLTPQLVLETPKRGAQNKDLTHLSPARSAGAGTVFTVPGDGGLSHLLP